MEASTRPPTTPKQFRYNEETDLFLLRESISVNPFDKKCGAGWQEISFNLSKTCLFPTSLTPRAVRDRVNLLIERHRKERKLNESRSGITEDFGEKEALLEELLQLKTKEAQVATAAGDKQKGNLFRQTFSRNLAMENMSNRVMHEMQETSTASESGKEKLTSTSTANPVAKLGKRRATDNGLYNYLQVRKEERELKLELEKEGMKVKVLELQMMREKYEEDREERRQEAARQREKEELDREERRQEAARQREKEEQDREERRQEAARQREKEELDREERRQEAARQREKDELDREERRELMKILIATLNKK